MNKNRLNHKKCLAITLAIALGANKGYANCKDQLASFAKEVVKNCEATTADARIKKVVTVPSSKTCNTVVYKISPEVNLDPGDTIYFDLPNDFNDRAVVLGLLNHRQDPNLPSNKGYKTGVYSTPPGRTSFQVFANPKYDPTGWRYYKNPSGGIKGSKFAAPSTSPEHETLYDWYKHGHASHSADDASFDLLYPMALRMVSVGKNPVLVSEVRLIVAPMPATSADVEIFSHGTKFASDIKAKDQKFGGGQSHYGHFPNALALGYSSSPSGKLPKGWRLTGNELEIPLAEGKKLSNVEVAVGDSHPDYDPNDPGSKTNEDGGYGTSGWSKLSIVLEKANGKNEILVNRENVPPQGIIGGAPVDCDYTAKAGDRLVIRADSDTSYIMGVRVSYQ